MKNLKYKKIRLYPTEFDLHVFLNIEHLEDLKDKFKIVFPKEVWESYFESLLRNNETAYVEALKIEEEGKTIVMVIKEPTDYIIVHEIVHVLSALSNYTNIEIGLDAQEWNAYFQEYLFKEIIELIKEN